MELGKRIKNRISCFKINFLPIVKLALKIGGGVFSAFAVVLAFVSLDEMGIKNVWAKIGLICGICIFSFLLSSFLVVFILKTNRIWSNGKNKVVAFYGDLMGLAFPKKAVNGRIVVIPVNDAFDTIIDKPSEAISDPLVSENTLHGSWLKLFFEKENVDSTKLDERVKKNLELNKITPEVVLKRSEKKRGNLESYPLGTIAVISGSLGVTYYLLVVSKFNQYNNAQSSKRDIRNAIDSLIDYYDSKGQGEPIYVPLVGTGSSRAGLSHEQSLKIIKSSVFASEKVINGSMSIVVYSGDRDKVSIFN